MHVLRNSPILACLVLAWFALTLGVAVASPAVHPQDVQLVCTDGGALKAVVVHDDGQAGPAAAHTLDCPACLLTTLPTLPAAAPAEVPQPLAHALHPIAAAHIAALAGAPLPPRGPPSLA